VSYTSRLFNAFIYCLCCIAASSLGILVSLGLLFQMPIGAYEVFKDER